MEYDFVRESAEDDERGTETAANVRDIMQLARTMGFRVTEAVPISRSQVEQALRLGIHQVKGETKNGKQDSRSSNR